MIVSVIAVLVSVFSLSAHAVRPDCEHAIASEEKFLFRNLHPQPAAEVARGTDETFVGVTYSSLTVDGEPALFFARDKDGLTLRWAGRASVAKLRHFAVRAIGDHSDARVHLKYHNTSGATESDHAGVPTLGLIYARIARHEARWFKDIGQKRPRGFKVRFAQPGAALDTEVAGSTYSRRSSLGVGVKFAPELLTQPEFAATLTELIDDTAAAPALWSNIPILLDYVRAIVNTSAE